MYCGQLEKARVFSVADRSSLVQPASVWVAALVPQPVRLPPVASRAADPRVPVSSPRRVRGRRGVRM
jgi:hypothetical protein